MSNQTMPQGAGTPPACPEPATSLPRHLDRARLNTKEASEYLEFKHGLRVAATSLNKWASTGGSPHFVKFGRSRLYTPSDLDAWAETKLSKRVNSTSELR